MPFQHNVNNPIKKILRRLIRLAPMHLRLAVRYTRVHKRFSLLLWPTTFTEKNWLRIAKDRRNLLRICADKLAMRRYVEQKVGPQYLPKILCQTQDPASINWLSLPERFVIKANHGSGFVSVVKGFDPADKARIEKLIETCKNWLAIDFAMRGGGEWEWAYRNCQRYIFIEEFIESPCHDEDGVPWDFKFYVFDGRCAIVQVDVGRFSSHRKNLYSTSWELLGGTSASAQTELPLARPENLDDLMKFAEKVGAGIDFVRVDVFAREGSPLVGELTMTPGGGFERFSNLKLDKYLGNKWKMAPFQDE